MSYSTCPFCGLIIFNSNGEECPHCGINFNLWNEYCEQEKEGK